MTIISSHAISFVSPWYPRETIFYFTDQEICPRRRLYYWSVITGFVIFGKWKIYRIWKSEILTYIRIWKSGSYDFSRIYKSGKIIYPAFLTGHYLLYLICILFLQMNFDHNAAPLQQLVDCSDAFSSNEVILIEKFYLHPIYFSIHPIQNIHKRKINLFFIFFAYFSSSLRTPNFSPDLNFRKMSKYPDFNIRL